MTGFRSDLGRVWDEASAWFEALPPGDYLLMLIFFGSLGMLLITIVFGRPQK